MLKCAFSSSATCRRPIKGAAERPVTSSPLWNESLLFSPLATQTASVVENRITNRLAGVPRSSGLNSSPSRPLFAPPSAGQSKALSRGTFPWVKLLLLAVLAALFFFIYQTMEPNSISPFNVAEVGGARDENP